MNDAQRRAVEYCGNLLVSAGAGTGKTHLLTQKFLYIVRERNIPEDNILTVTFTNKASEEMKKRLLSLSLDPKHVSTFHGTCTKILRTHGILINLNKFTIVDQSEQISFLKKYNNSPRELLDKILFAKENGTIINSPIFFDYQKFLKENNKLDFADLMINTVLLFEQESGLLKYYRDRFKIIMVDEYQDTNDVQYKIIKMLGNGNEVCCVGDENQSIYEWRGSKPDIFNTFVKEFNAKTIQLEENYRSKQDILDVAKKIINTNLKANVKGKGDINFKLFDDPYEEARYIVHNISPGSAILVRLISQIPFIENELINNNIPYKMYSAVSLYDREEIKNIIAYVKLVYKNDNEAFERIVNVPKKGIGDASIKKLYETDSDLLKASSMSSKKQLLEFYNLIMNARKIKLPYEIVVNILSESKYLESLEEERKIHVQRFLETIREIKSIEEFILNICDTNKVQVMTIHAAKGLEFDTVYIPGVSEGILPASQNTAEEKRLLYTAITRAKSKLCITACKKHLINNRMIGTDVSRFIPKDIINV